MKSVSVDKNKCVACGACLSCTEYFYDGEDGKACTYKRIAFTGHNNINSSIKAR